MLLFCSSPKMCGSLITRYVAYGTELHKANKSVINKQINNSL